jgi:hypothetical protein
VYEVIRNEVRNPRVRALFLVQYCFCENGVDEEVLKWKAKEDSTMDDGYKWEFG